jgi:hypothetical protein
MMNKGNLTVKSSGPNLQEWLDVVYFGGHRNADLTRENWLSIISRMRTGLTGESLGAISP